MVSWKKKLYIYGGCFGQSHGNDLWVFIPNKKEESRWKRLNTNGITQQPAKRHCHTACMWKSSMVVFGGDSGGNEILNDLWILDFGVGWNKLSWKRIDPKQNPHDVPSPRYAHTACVIHDCLFVYGGFTRDSRKTGMYLDEMWKFDLKKQVWAKIKSPSHKLPVARCYHTAVPFHHEKIIVYGGSSVAKQYLNDLWVFDCVTCKWIELLPTDPSPAGRTKHAATIYNDSLMFIHGGYSGLFRENELWVFFLDNESKPKWIKLEYTPETLSYSPVARESHTITMIGKDLWLFGGSGKATRFNDCWKVIVENVISLLPTFDIHSNQSTPQKTDLNESEITEGPDYSEDELFSKLNAAIAEEERRISLEKNQSSAEKHAVVLHRGKENTSQIANESYTNIRLDQSMSTDLKIQEIERKINHLSHRQTLEEERNKQYYQELIEEVNHMKSILRQQSNSMNDIEAVINKEIQTRATGEDKTQAYFQFLMTQITQQMEIQAQQHQLSVTQVKKMMETIERKFGAGPTT